MNDTPRSENSPLRVRCLLCKESLTLNEDSPETRAVSDDPHQQMRRHLLTHGPLKLSVLANRCGWIIDLLSFDCPTDPDRFRNNAIQLLDAYLRGEI